MFSTSIKKKNRNHLTISRNHPVGGLHQLMQKRRAGHPWLLTCTILWTKNSVFFGFKNSRDAEFAIKKNGVCDSNQNCSSAKCKYSFPLLPSQHRAMSNYFVWCHLRVQTRLNTVGYEHWYVLFHLYHIHSIVLRLNKCHSRKLFHGEGDSTLFLNIYLNCPSSCWKVQGDSFVFQELFICAKALVSVFCSAR